MGKQTMLPAIAKVAGLSSVKRSSKARGVIAHGRPVIRGSEMHDPTTTDYT